MMLTAALLGAIRHPAPHTCHPQALYRLLSQVASAGAPAPAPVSQAQDAAAEQPSTSGRWIHAELPRELPHYVGKQKKVAVPLMQALEMVKASARAKFDETVEAAIKLKVDPRKGDQMVRGACELPHGNGKTVRVAVFALGEDAEVARREGADVVGDEALIQAIMDSKGAAIDFDKVVATPDMMKSLARLGKILGPKGLMPSPKLGTLTPDVAAAIRALRRGRAEYRVDRTSIVHVGLGKVSMAPEQLYLNFGSLAQSLVDTKPKSIRGAGLAGYVQSLHVSSTMGPSVQVEPSSLVAAAQLYRKGVEEGQQ